MLKLIEGRIAIPAEINAAKESLNKLFLATSIPSGDQWVVKTQPYQPTLILRHLRHATQGCPWVPRSCPDTIWTCAAVSPPISTRQREPDAPAHAQAWTMRRLARIRDQNCSHHWNHERLAVSTGTRLSCTGAERNWARVSLTSARRDSASNVHERR